MICLDVDFGGVDLVWQESLNLLNFLESLSTLISLLLGLQ